MADDKPDDELDEEIAELEDELADLEEGSDGAEDTPEEGDQGFLSGLMDRFGGEEDDAATEETDAPEDAPVEDAEEASPPEVPEPEDEPHAAEEVDAPADETGAPEPSPAQKRASDRWVETEDGWRRLDEDEIPAAAEEPEEEPDAQGLLARFQGSEDDEPEEPDEAPAHGAEKLGPPRPREDDGAGWLLIVAGIIGILLLLALLAAGATVLFGGGADVSAAVTSDALEQDGAFVAATGAPIALDASGSSGPIEEYRWDFGDGETTTTQEPTVEHAYAERGSFTVTLTVAGDGSTSEDTLDVTVVEAPDAVPEVRFNGSTVAEPGTVGNNPFVGDTVELDATGSSADQETELTTWEWDVDGDGSPDATGASTTTSFDQAGAWTVTLTVTDGLGNTDSTERPVHVADEQTFANETIGPAVPQAVSNLHNVTHAQGRDGASPVQLDATLVYSSAEGQDDVQGDPNPDLDLSVESPLGTVYEAEDDAAEGRETLTVDQGEIDALGTWAYNVTQDPQDGLVGAGTEVEYTLTVRTIY